MAVQVPDGVQETAGVFRARELLGAEDAEGWCLEGLAGRLVEVSGGAATGALTVVGRVILEAQRRGELAAWVGRTEAAFYPPDFAALGIDLEALPVVHVGQEGCTLFRVTELLIRSGSFSVVVLDLWRKAGFSLAAQTRLAGLAKEHHTALLCVTRRRHDYVPLGSLVSIRGEAERKRVGFDRFSCGVRVVKDKRRGPGWGHEEIHHGPGGLC